MLSPALASLNFRSDTHFIVHLENGYGESTTRVFTNRSTYLFLVFFRICFYPCLYWRRAFVGERAIIFSETFPEYHARLCYCTNTLQNTKLLAKLFITVCMCLYRSAPFINSTLLPGVLVLETCPNWRHVLVLGKIWYLIDH